MSKKASKTLIGGFVVGAVALVVAGVLVFGSGRFLAPSYPYVMYFTGSVKGLSVGAPVLFRGVKIGSVKDIVLRVDPADMSFRIPVFIEIEPYRFGGIESDWRKRKGGDGLELLIERGLRAQLQLQSMVTGQLMIELDFYPDTPVRLVGSDIEYPEIPTIPSSMEQLSKTIQNLPLEELANKLTAAISGIERAVNSPEVAESLTTMNETLKDLQKLVQNINSQVDPIGSGLEETGKNVQKLVQDVDGHMRRLLSSIEKTTKSLNGALEQAEKTLGAIEGVTGRDSALVYQLTKTLEELSAAARSIRIWADYLERHPEALIRGKGGSRGR